MDIVIPRFTRTYGPTMLPDDTKAIFPSLLAEPLPRKLLFLRAGEPRYDIKSGVERIINILRHEEENR